MFVVQAWFSPSSLEALSATVTESGKEIRIKSVQLDSKDPKKGFAFLLEVDSPEENAREPFELVAAAARRLSFMLVVPLKCICTQVRPKNLVAGEKYSSTIFLGAPPEGPRLPARSHSPGLARSGLSHTMCITSRISPIDTIETETRPNIPLLPPAIAAISNTMGAGGRRG
jgi:hypothetical protein